MESQSRAKLKEVRRAFQYVAVKSLWRELFENVLIEAENDMEEMSSSISMQLITVFLLLM